MPTMHKGRGSSSAGPKPSPAVVAAQGHRAVRDEPARGDRAGFPAQAARDENAGRAPDHAARLGVLDALSREISSRLAPPDLRLYSPTRRRRAARKIKGINLARVAERLGDV